MTNQSTNFKIGDRIQVSDRHFNPLLRGAIGVISQPPTEVIERNLAWQTYWKPSSVGEGKVISRIYWVELHPVVLGDDPDHPIEAGEFEETDLMHVSK